MSALRRFDAAVARGTTHAALAHRVERALLGTGRSHAEDELEALARVDLLARVADVAIVDDGGAGRHAQDEAL